MQLPFVNRRQELKELDAAAAAGGLLVIFGRRRVGKTRLLAHWLGRHKGLYSQAIESSREIQLDQIYRDFQAALSTAVVPKSWEELLEILRLQPEDGRSIICLDEFPYLVTSDSSLPSVLQRWLDHSQPRGSLLVLAGSSTRMMHDLFLNRRLLKLLERACGNCSGADRISSHLPQAHGAYVSDPMSLRLQCLKKCHSICASPWTWACAISLIHTKSSRLRGWGSSL